MKDLGLVFQGTVGKDKMTCNWFKAGPFTMTCLSWQVIFVAEEIIMNL